MIPNLSIRQLQTFREIMRSGSVTAASRVLGRTQPSVSAMLASLETALGYALFERRKGRLIPKPEANFFLEETQEILDRVSRAAQTMHEIGNLDRGRLRIASMPGPSLFLLPRLIADFVKDRPHVKASVMTRSSLKVHEWIASQQYDIGLAEIPARRGSTIVEPINLECVCALRMDDPLAEKDLLTPDDLDNAPMAALSPEHFTHRAAKRIFDEAGKRFNIRFETTIFTPAFTFVEQGLAYCLVDQISAASYRLYRGPNAQLAFRRFRPRLPFDIAIMTPAHRQPSRLARALCEQIPRGVQRFIETIQ